MISIEITLSSQRVIQYLFIKGHAGFSTKGTDIVCAAVSILSRTFCRQVEATAGVRWKIGSDNSQEFQFIVDEVEASSLQNYQGQSWFLLRGLSDLALEYPKSVQVVLKDASGRLHYGT